MFCEVIGKHSQNKNDYNLEGNEEPEFIIARSGNNKGVESLTSEPATNAAEEHDFESDGPLGEPAHASSGKKGRDNGDDHSGSFFHPAENSEAQKETEESDNGGTNSDHPGEHSSASHANDRAGKNKNNADNPGVVVHESDHTASIDLRASSSVFHGDLQGAWVASPVSRDNLCVALTGDCLIADNSGSELILL